jgi:hypothetical protein
MTALGIAALALLFAWLLGGFLLRLGGWMLIFVAAIGLAVSGNGNSVPVAAVGAVLWLLGHAHYGLRRGIWKSRLAQRLWCSVGSALSRLVSAALHRLGARSGEQSVPRHEVKREV